mmetsp:Transcript_4503/g.12956  ORF Transcript_4503/g.12956 Transcript_4503/m.12956 type:complete len:203 (+) Transcript_4503:1281-1889(+)
MHHLLVLKRALSGRRVGDSRCIFCIAGAIGTEQFLEGWHDLDDGFAIIRQGGLDQRPDASDFLGWFVCNDLVGETGECLDDGTKWIGDAGVLVVLSLDDVGLGLGVACGITIFLMLCLLLNRSGSSSRILFLTNLIAELFHESGLSRPTQAPDECGREVARRTVLVMVSSNVPPMAVRGLAHHDAMVHRLEIVELLRSAEER